MINRKTLPAVIGLAFLLRVIYLFTLEPVFYFGDEPLYEEMARNFLAGAGLNYGANYQAFRPPLFPLLTSLIHLLGGGLAAVRFFNVVASTVTVYLVYRLGAAAFCRRTGLLAAAAAATWPFFIYYNGLYLTESLYVMLVVAAALYLTRAVAPTPAFSPTAAVVDPGADSGRSSRLSGEVCPATPPGDRGRPLISRADFPAPAAAGFLLGLTLLCRPTLIAFVPVALFFAWKAGGPSGGRKACVIGLACLLTITPWIVRNFVVLGAFVPGTTMGGRVLYEGNNPHSVGGPCQVFPPGVDDLPELERDQVYYRLAFRVIGDDPGRFFRLMGNKFRRFWSPVPNAPGFRRGIYGIISLTAMGLTIPFFLAGFLASTRSAKSFFLVAPIIYATLFHMVFLSSIRYRLPIEPLYLVLAARGFRLFTARTGLFSRLTFRRR